MNKLIKKSVTVLVGAIATASIAMSAVACNFDDDTAEEEPHVHDYKLQYIINADCETDETYVYKCSGCGDVKSEVTKSALGHVFTQSSEGARFIVPCERDGCVTYGMPENSGKYSSQVVYTFTEDDQKTIDALWESIEQPIIDIGPYTEDDVYDESSPLYAQEEEISSLCDNDYTAWLSKVQVQRRYARILYDIDPTNETAKANYQYINDYYTDMVTNYYSVFKLLYDSRFRNFAYHGWDEEDIQSAVASSETYGSGELGELRKRNVAIENEFDALEDASTDSKLLDLYEEYASNNNKIAVLLGYDNYLDYAYEVDYGRDYTYKDVSTFAAYIKQYIAPSMTTLIQKYQTSVKSLTNNEKVQVTSIDDGSFFTNKFANDTVNDFLDTISVYGTINFAENFEGLISDGAYFLGGYEGAYETYLPSLKHPVILYGEEYQTPSQIVHEFGHYSNDLYGNYKYDQSYDLYETHSQGMEALFFSYVKSQSDLTTNAANAYVNYKLFYDMMGVLMFMSVDTFEQAIYTGEYTGTNSDTILADGKISKDEYDTLFQSIMSDYGLKINGSYLGNPYYWRYVTIPQACYYVSYAVSALGSIQLYTKAQTSSLEDAVVAYDKLITYTSEHSKYTYSQVLEYAGLYAVTSEQLYKDLNTLFNS